VDKGFLEDCLAQGMSLDSIGELKGKHPSTVSYWLKKHGLTAAGRERHAPKGSIDTDRLRKLVLEGVAKCNTAAVSERRRNVKRKLVAEAGGSCRLCGFDAHPAALQFHHRDPSKKAFHLSHGGMTRGIGRMRAEARKCVLLCANCHALVEAGVKKVPVEER
jgi:predicted HNH restriction endonuclease